MSQPINSFNNFITSILEGKQLYSCVEKGHPIQAFDMYVLRFAPIVRLQELWMGRLWYYNSPLIDACLSQIQGHKDSIEALKLKIKEAQKTDLSDF